jgi:LPS-assembly protein
VKIKRNLRIAKVTTCEAGQNEWFISSDETVIDQSSGNIKAKDAVLSLRGIPIMYSPYVDFSTTSQRRSGWLLPTAGQQPLAGLRLLSLLL